MDWGMGKTSLRSAIGTHSRRGEIREVSHRRPQDINEACHHGVHSEVSHRRPQYISEACHHGAHRILVWPAIAALKLSPVIAALTMFINDTNFAKDNIPCTMIHLDY